MVFEPSISAFVSTTYMLNFVPHGTMAIAFLTMLLPHILQHQLSRLVCILSRNIACYLSHNVDTLTTILGHILLHRLKGFPLLYFANFTHSFLLYDTCFYTYFFLISNSYTFLYFLSLIHMHSYIFIFEYNHISLFSYSNLWLM